MCVSVCVCVCVSKERGDTKRERNKERNPRVRLVTDPFGKRTADSGEEREERKQHERLRH